MNTELKYEQALDVIVGLSSDIQELKKEMETLKARNSRYAEKIIKLKEKLQSKEIVDRCTKALIRDLARKVKHLFPLENRPGYGQLCEIILKFEKALKEIKETYEYGQPNHSGEVMVEVEDTCDAMYQIAVKATGNLTKLN